MPVFAVNGNRPDALRDAVKATYPNAHHEAWPGFYLVADEATTQQVGEKLAIADGSKGNVFIASLAGNYWGFGPKDAWEWLDLKRRSER